MFVLLFSMFASPVFADDNTTWEPLNPGIKPEQTDMGNSGMVVTAHPLASEVGAEILKQGGNAVDAAVAVQFALNVVEPHMSGIGGGGFMMYYDAEKEEISLVNSRERAPGKATPDMFYDKSELVLDEGGAFLAAIDLSPKEEGSGAFHIGELSLTELESDDEFFTYYFDGEPGTPWTDEHFELDERGTSFTIDEQGGKIEFGPAVGSNRSSLGLTKLKIDPVKNSEAFMKFKLDDPGDDKRLRFWLRADEYRSGSTYPVNGIGFEIDSKNNTLKVIHSYESSSTTVATIDLPETDEWQNIRFNLEDNTIKVRVWDDEIEEPVEWNIDEVLLGTLPSFQDRVRSGKSVGVPGTLKGLETALEKWGSGKFELADLLQPAIDLAENGHEVNWQVASSIANNADKLTRTAAKDVFLPGGEPLKEGDILVQKDLAKTFRMIAEQGTEVFYKGDIAEAIVNEVQKFGGWMEIEDLENYKVTHEEPVRGTYKGYEIVTMPPPSSGGLTMLQILKMTELLNVTSFDVRSPEKYHYLAEAFRLAYADRGKYMGDPEHADIPAEGLLNDDYIKQRVETIKDDEANANIEPGNPWDYQEGGPTDEGAVYDETENVEDVDADRTEGETTHFTVADRWGNMVSYTTTIEQVFGSGIMVDGYGFLLNNELTDFDAVPGGVNQVEANKRPLSSMTPTIVLKDGKPYMTVGSPGGATIITSVMQTILNKIGYDMELKDAVEEPRIYTNAYPNIRWEIGVPSSARSLLERYGHVWESNPVDIGNVNALVIEDDPLTGEKIYYGAADSTRQGTAIGIVDSTILADKLQEIEDTGLVEDEYTKESWAALQEAITQAKAVLEDENATLEDVNTVYGALVAALLELEKVPEDPEEPEKPNKEALEKKVSELEELDSSKYTKESWKAFEVALEAAKAVLADENATQEEIDAALGALNEAFEALEEVDDNGAKTPVPGKNKGKDKKPGKGGKLPKTATPMFNTLLIGLVLLTSGVAVYVYRLRKTKVGKEKQ